MEKKELISKLAKVLDVNPLIAEIIIEEVYALPEEMEGDEDEKLQSI